MDNSISLRAEGEDNMELTDHGYRAPAVPYPEDFRYAVQIAAEAAAIVDEIRAAFLASDEMKTLHEVFDPKTRVEVRIDSSRKYTRFHFPNCPKFKFKLRCILQRHNCEIVGNEHTCGEFMAVQIATNRLGCPYEIIAFPST